MTKMMLPAGRNAERRHLEFSEDMQCWTVRCAKCGEDLPCDEEFFAFDGRLPAPWCKACKSEYARAYHARRGKKLRAEQRAAAAN